GHPSGSCVHGSTSEKVNPPDVATVETVSSLLAQSGVTQVPPAFHPLDVIIPIRKPRFQPSFRAKRISAADFSLRNSGPAGTHPLLCTAATSHTSPPPIPFAAISSSSYAIRSRSTLPFSHGQNARGRVSIGGDLNPDSNVTEVVAG